MYITKFMYLIINFLTYIIICVNPCMPAIVSNYAFTALQSPAILWIVKLLELTISIFNLLKSHYLHDAYIYRFVCNLVRLIYPMVLLRLVDKSPITTARTIGFPVIVILILLVP